MKKSIPYIVVALLVVFGSIAQKPTQVRRQDPVINLRLTLPQLSSVIYSIRNSTLLDAKSANELADILVSQANDTTLNKAFIQAQQPIPKQK